MNEREITNEFIQLIEDVVKVDADQLKNAVRETHIIKDLKINSARLVDIIIKAEEVFDIEIDDDDADSIRTIGDAVDVVARKLDAVEAAA